MSNDATSTPVKRKGRFGRIFLSVLLVLAVGLGIYVRNVTKSRATPPASLPTPNAYDGLLKVAQGISPKLSNEGKFEEAKLEELKTFVDASKQHLTEVRNFLGKPSQVPLIYKADLTEVMSRMSVLRTLSRVFQAEGVLALRENRHEDAAQSYLDMNQLGPAIGKGGIWIDVLVGIAVETVGQSGFRRAIPQVSKEKLREALTVLREVDQNRDTLKEVKNTETYWSEQTQPFYILLSLKLSGMYDKLIEPAHKAGGTAILRAQAGNHQLQLDIAKQLYKMDHGQEPDDPAQLVPTYLPDVPKNPATGNPISGVTSPAPLP